MVDLIADSILGNVYKVAFWTMAFLAYDSDLLQVIRQEVAPSIHDDRIEEEKLIESCPKLQSVINEVLRLSITTGLVRDIVKPTLVQGKILRPGNKLMVSAIDVPYYILLIEMLYRFHFVSCT